MSADGPHSRACGLYCQGHGTACSRDCPTCGGADATPSPTGDADALPSIPPWRPSDGPQAGPGWVMTTHGPIRRAMPPWDVPAAPDDDACGDRPRTIRERLQ